MLRTGAALFFFLAAAGSAGSAAAAARQPLQLHHVRLELPGPPATVLAADLDGDELLDLAVVVAYTDLETIGVDRVENLVQVSTVIPALFERRELRVFAGRADGSFAPVGEPLPLGEDVLGLAAARDGRTLWALTDAGVSRLDTDAAAPEGFRFTSLIDDPPVLAGTGTFYARLTFTGDVDGDGDDDLILPAVDGPAIYRHGTDGLATVPALRLELPGDQVEIGAWVRRTYPLPEFRDTDGDGRDDLVSVDDDGRVAVFLGDGGGGFRPHRGPTPDDALIVMRDADGKDVTPPGRLAYFGDIDGTPGAEWIGREELVPEKMGLRKGMRQMKRPRHRYRIHALRDDMSVDAEPLHEFEIEGHAFQDADFGAGSVDLFQDLDGDGRAELIVVTLRFSMFQALKVLATKRVSVGLDFHVHAQDADGSFRQVEGLDLSERMRFDLEDVQLNRFGQFAGDFDGDGRTDFVHLGRGRQITIHRGQPGARYPTKPDRVIELEQAPQHLGLVRIDDLDGDGRADLSVTRVLEAERADVSAPVVLDLYLSGGGT